MVRAMEKTILDHPQNHANWLHLLLLVQKPFYEVAIVGKDYKNKSEQILREYLPHTLIAATEEEGEILLLKNRYVPGTTQIYICEEGACQLPLTQIKKVLTQLHVQEDH
jgi:uncharacterized protein YyaL (SSP411 family)